MPRAPRKYPPLLPGTLFREEVLGGSTELGPPSSRECVWSHLSLPGRGLAVGFPGFWVTGGPKTLSSPSPHPQAGALGLEDFMRWARKHGARWPVPISGLSSCLEPPHLPFLLQVRRPFYTHELPNSARSRGS